MIISLDFIRVEAARMPFTPSGELSIVSSSVVLRLVTVRKLEFTDILNSTVCAVSVCAIDLSKAFDMMNHHVLFIKLMHHLVPSVILKLLET